MIQLAPETISDVATTVYTEINPDAVVEEKEGAFNTNGLIADLAWILLLGALVTLLFKKLKQPVVLGYILAGFIASPKFIWLPSISNLENIDFWAEIGIVVLMFTLGLEFSFKKLVNAGSSAVVTALIIITGMTFAGFGVGKLLHLNTINCIFLGGMISMSSTTIILKALTDLGLRQKKFASLVLAVLIIEDLFAVLMLVLLSSIAQGDAGGTEILLSAAKLGFFLILWFVVGVYVIPTFLHRTRRMLNDETLLVVSMGLCFAMAIASVSSGFSLELGAFVMGSLLAGTIMAERIEHVVKPVKDLFGAVFFISVGMMVDPQVIGQYWSEILLLATVVVIGMIIFGTLGMLLTGQSLRVAIESGFTLTQIGEFSFIIASLGMSLGVLEESLYPIIVAVSVITIFTTPYFIKMAVPAAAWIEGKLPKSLNFLIDRYSKQTSDSSENRRLWKVILTRNVWRMLLYAVILVAIVQTSLMLFFPLMIEISAEWGRLLATLITLGVMSPFLAAMMSASAKKSEKIALYSSASFVDVPLVAIRIVKYIVALLFIVWMISSAYRPTIGWICGIICFVFIALIGSRVLKKRFRQIETKFINNLNIRENTRLGVNNNLVSDMHQAYIEVGPYCTFVGDRLKDSGMRRNYGISVSSIQRGQRMIPLPSHDARIFPGDILGIIGTDEQIKRLNDDLDHCRIAYENENPEEHEVKLMSLRLTPSSPIVNHPLSAVNLRHVYSSMIVKIDRDGEYIQPKPDTVLLPDDIIWVVGDPKKIEKMK